MGKKQHDDPQRLTELHHETLKSVIGRYKRYQNIIATCPRHWCEFTNSWTNNTYTLSINRTEKKPQTLWCIATNMGSQVLLQGLQGLKLKWLLVICHVLAFLNIIFVPCVYSQLLWVLGTGSSLPDMHVNSMHHTSALEINVNFLTIKIKGNDGKISFEFQNLG